MPFLKENLVLKYSRKKCCPDFVSADSTTCARIGMKGCFRHAGAWFLREARAALLCGGEAKPASPRVTLMPSTLSKRIRILLRLVSKIFLSRNNGSELILARFHLVVSVRTACTARAGRDTAVFGGVTSPRGKMKTFTL